MFGNNIANSIMQATNALAEPTPTQSATFDSVTYDSTDARSTYELTNLRLSVASAIAAWAETDDLDDGETLSDRLYYLMWGIIDIDKNGEIDAEEADLMEKAYQIAADYLVDKGAEESDIVAFLNDDDDDAAENIQELLRGSLPDGEEAETDDLEAFAFGEGDGSEDTAMDAVYKRKIAVRNGKKVIVRKRIAGKVRLSAAQKKGIMKMLRKSHNGKARLKRMKSLRKRKSMGL
ncbi:hypothetical protein LVJ82_17280 [Vitreoscilla massiliensis]|uniref:EF-hand domain-containing protein n=1 Tax=Vitreoscilla massiliensis TaxID=1689272 RepID=A0ABY4E1I7_9NEIS|nr:hypothetical protein [Vitreoscilla massiliensis]UOO89173.1 hypothetical protein LVJ82_17280 [Vitreoscilla massiliensis]